MKRLKLLLVFIFSTFVFIPNIFAANMKVKFTTSFANNIDLESIDAIYVTINPKDFSEKEIELTYAKDFTHEEMLNINEVVVSDVFVARDYSGKYNWSYEKIEVSPNEVEVKIKLTLSPKKETKTSAVINESIYGDVFGEDYVNRITEKMDVYGVDDDYVDSGNNGNGSGNGSGGNNGGNENNTTTSSVGSENSTTLEISTGTTTNEYGQTDKDLEKQKQQQEKEEAEAKRQEGIEKRNKIYIYILIAFICIIIIAIIVVLIKFSKANK